MGRLSSGVDSSSKLSLIAGCTSPQVMDQAGKLPVGTAGLSIDESKDGVETQAPHTQCWGDVKWCSPLGKQSGSFSDGSTENYPMTQQLHS